jgi:hypothetical protein
LRRDARQDAVDAQGHAAALCRGLRAALRRRLGGGTTVHEFHGDTPDRIDALELDVGAIVVDEPRAARLVDVDIPNRDPVQ